MDTKWDFLWFHLPTIVATFADAAGRGQLAFLALASSEDPAIVELLIKLLIHNVPCSDPNCPHESQLTILDDGSGWYVSPDTSSVCSHCATQVPHSQVCDQAAACSPNHARQIAYLPGRSPGGGSTLLSLRLARH